MPEIATIERRTSADDVFDFLNGQINSLQLLPGTRISEVEIAKSFDVSRQPVREAFIRLANRGLILVRPQKATIVRRFSIERIQRARFIRLAIECEVLRRACSKPLGSFKRKLDRSLSAQEKAIKDNDIDRFHALDYEFHKTLCSAADAEFVFETIADNKAQLDRLCLLSLSEPAAMEELHEDHVELFEALVEQNEEKVLASINRHLSRLESTVAGIRKSHAEYFED